ncbi:hypothetical protein C1645_830580 [Glomus cerebriforme]|uniref:Uncharacterized protein n=1 Tax=Glomus cerebriforme TaxID=658196 RepID=A0A397SLT4_9GLOM|nr:hypothetical protein C1645_830580 [Glomus cerebriforme]
MRFGMGIGICDGIWDGNWDWDGIRDWDGNGIWDGMGWDGMGFNMGGNMSTEEWDSKGTS